MHIGRVTRVEPAGASSVVFVELAAIAPGFEVGPCEIVQSAEGAAAVTGARVVVAMVDPDTAVVVGVLPG